METKKIALIPILFLSFCCIAQSRLDRRALPFSEDALKTSFLHYEEGINWEKEYAVNFEIKATFNIDTSGNIINLKIDSKTHLAAIEKFIAKRIMSTTGSWLPAIKNCKLTISDTITFVFRKRTTKEEQEKIEIERAKYAYWDTYAVYHYQPTGLWGYYRNYEFDVTYDCPVCLAKVTKVGE